MSKETAPESPPAEEKAKPVKDPELTAEDQMLWNTAFNDALSSARTDNPNPFWATAAQVAGDKPVTLDINREFLQKHHSDRIFAQGALAGFKAFDEVQKAKAERDAAQADVEKKRKTLKKEDPPIDDIPPVDENINLIAAWEKATPHLRPKTPPQKEEPKS